MKLWTFQSIDISILSEQPFEPNWEFVPVGLRPKYEWMAKKLSEKTNQVVDNAPIWCWHSCGAFGRAPTSVDAEALFSETELSCGIQMLTLAVPEHFVLLSSYSVWNELLDCDTKEFDESTIVDLFTEPLIKFDGDSIQAVIPYVDKNWTLSCNPIKNERKN